MKNLFFSLTLLCLPLALFCQTKSINNFYDQYKNFEDVTSINLTGGLLKFVFAASDDEDVDKVKNKVTGVKVLLMERGNHVDASEYKRFIKSVKRENFEELFKVKDGGDAVDFHLREEGDTITDLLITVRGEDGFVLLSIEGNFQYSDLEGFDIDVEGAEHLKKLPKDRSKIKRA